MHDFRGVGIGISLFAWRFGHFGYNAITAFSRSHWDRRQTIVTGQRHKCLRIIKNTQPCFFLLTGIVLNEPKPVWQRVFRRTQKLLNAVTDYFDLHMFHEMAWKNRHPIISDRNIAHCDPYNQCYMRAVFILPKKGGQKCPKRHIDFPTVIYHQRLCPDENCLDVMFCQHSLVPRKW